MAGAGARPRWPTATASRWGTAVSRSSAARHERRRQEGRVSDQLLLALKAGFVILLFLFVWRVLRIQARDLRAVPETGSATEIRPPHRGTTGEIPLGPRLVVLSSPVYPPGTLVRLDGDVAFRPAPGNHVVPRGGPVRSQR